MFPTLLRRFLGPILLLALLVLGVRPAQASHLLGGEMSYRFLDANGPAANPFRYEVTVTLYSNGDFFYNNVPGNTQIAEPPRSAPITLYNRTTGAQIGNTISIARTSPAVVIIGGIQSLPPPVRPPVPAGCTVIGPSQPFYLCKYTQIVNLPVSFDGYYAVYSVAARNNTLTNINNPNSVPLTLYVSMAPPLISNRSPVFADTAVAIVCSNDTTITLNNAVDPDGDRLVYSFGTPYGNLTNPNAFPPLPQPVPYFTGFSAATPFGTGPGNVALINATTGIAKYKGTINGLYGVAVDVSEYRNINGQEVLLGTTRRDVQLVVSTCPPTTPPVLPLPVLTPRNYTIEEGQSLSIPITATQASSNHPLVLTVNSVLLDGSGPFNTTFNGSTGTVQPGNVTGTATATGNGSVSGTFVFNSTCGNARATAYDLAVTVKDNGCGGRLASDLFRVTVNRAAGPNAINGPVTVCDPATVRNYTAAGPTPTSYIWSITGGTISSGQGTNSVNVTWANANTTGRLVLRGISAYGCRTDSVVKTVDIRPLPALTVTPSAPSICLGASSTLTVAGQAGLTYSWTGGGQSSTTNTLTVTPTATTTYTVTGTDGTCTISANVTVIVTPLPVANAGADRDLCPSLPGGPAGPTTQLGAAPVTGYTYSWSPALGLSSTTVANPTLSLTNTTGAPVVQPYTLTVTAGNNCTSTATVRVTVNPAAIADAGPVRATCSGVASAPIGTTALTGYTYSWSPALGLSSATAAQPTVTLTNITGVPTTNTYTVTATSPQGCLATSAVVVTVNPAAVATPGPAISFCSGTVSVPLGGTAVAVPGTIYSWSPTTGLSNPNILNPTVTDVNTTGAPIIRTYTLTATTANGCIAIATVAVTINPAAVADAGPARQTCSNVPVGIGGTAIAGTTYAWAPDPSLSSTSVANPTVTLANLTGSNITRTYTLTATTANGCTATGTVTVTVFPAAVANAGPAVAFCSGETRTLGSGTAVAGTTYSWTPPTGLSTTTSLTPTITLTNTGTGPATTPYTLTATTANGCTASSTVAVTVNQAAVANAGPAKQTCSNVGVSIGTGTPIAGTTYSWTPATGLSSATSLTPTLTLANLTSAPIVYPYLLTATTAQGCTATSTVNVTINPAAVAQAGVDKQTCSNVGVVIGTGTAIAGTTYAWTPATGLSSATVLTPTVTLPNLTGAAITQQYILLATTANGCFQRDTVVVTINPAAVAVAGASRAVCSGVPTTLGAAPVTGYTYSWSPTGSGLSSTTVANPTFTLPNLTNAPITQLFTLTATTANGCVASSTVTVTVNPAAVADAGPDVAVCDRKTVVLGTTARTGYTYSWSPNNNLSSVTAAQPVFTGVNTTALPITANYTVTATTANGCTSTDAVVITINPRPTAEAITGPVSVCPTVTGIAYSVVTPAATAYTWLINGGTIASGQGTPAITVNWGTATPGGFVKVFRLNAQGCSSDTTTLPVIINQQLQTVRPTGPGDVQAVAPVPTSVCQANGPYTYRSGVFANGSSYSWAIVGGTQVSTAQNTVTVNWDPVTVPTIRTIVVTETSNPAGGICRGTSTALQVLVNPSPLGTLAITSPVRVCQTSGPVTFALPGGFTGSTYVFQLAGATLAGTGNTRTLATLPAPGTYPLTAQETSVAGCVGPLYTTTFTVSPTPAAPSISGSGFVCNTATAQQYAIANATAGATYQWTIVGGSITSLPVTASTVTVLFGATGPYSVSAVEISASPASCPSPATTRVIILDNPGITLTNASVDATSNSRIILTLSVPNSANTPNPVRILRRVAGSGTFAQVGTVAASATTYTDNAVDATANSYEYQLGLTNGCATNLTSATDQTMRLLATSAAGAGGYDQGGTTLTWNAFVGFPVAEYRIYRRTDAGTAVLVKTVVPTSPLTSPLQTTVTNADLGSATGAGFSQSFRVVAASAGGALLSNSNETSVSFDNAIKTYNVITPNGDNKNDVLVIDNIQLYPGNSLTVFNRWGREVYKATNYQNNWGGDANTAPGVYYYLLTVPNGPSTKGWIEVVK